MAFHGLLDNGLLYERFHELEHEGMRLGRHLWLDARSLSHMIENRIELMNHPVRTTLWDRPLVVLDQGKLGSCTGNAGTGALGTQPFYDKVGKSVLPAANDALHAEGFAVSLYEAATVIDGYPGVYPPDDTGSSGLAICKVLKARGTIKGYRYARSAHGFLRLLQHGPVLQGMPWHNAFFEPDAQGFIDSHPSWSSSGLAGGHEVEAIGVEIDTDDVFSSAVTYVNSWGTGWGDAGRFRMRLRTYEQLHSVDLKQYVI